MSNYSNALKVPSKFLLQDSVESDTIDLHGTWGDKMKQLPADQSNFVKDLLDITFSYLHDAAR
ncbi:hypothetical protein [Acutalibacter caecimuris]|uniref:hypothetical protein n=1 Tax=Acutalibacter caecimuris TaxID=3093657 RepID=UPI002AC8D27C|nr:hypothetical protein [Acutalibacter sp. M00118]